MTDKEKILNEIEKTKEHLANLKKMLVECECERWKPKKKETYYYVSSKGRVKQNMWTNEFTTEDEQYNFYNCFQTREQAKAEAEKILVRRMLEDIARRLNKGEKINYEDNAQCKFCLVYNIVKDRIEIDSDYNCVRIGVVYCLSMNFYKVAIQEIGEERLKAYLKGEYNASKS